MLKTDDGETDDECLKNENHQYIRIVNLQGKLLEGMQMRNLDSPKEKKKHGKFQKYIRTNEEIEGIDRSARRLPGATRYQMVFEIT